MLERIVAALKREEGFRPFVYDDATGAPIVSGYTVVGHPTLWYGLCVEVGRVPDLPISIAEDVLELVVARSQAALLLRLPWLDAQPEEVQRAVIEMAYQLGIGGVLQFARMLSALEAGNRDEAARHALDSKWAKQTPARAQRVAALIRGDI
jgi:lysozyme